MRGWLRRNFASPRALNEAGVLGINGRNARYVADWNPSRLMPKVNDKLRTKRIAEVAGVPAPDLYGTVEIQAHVRRLLEILGGREEFVVKPALGTQGDGIMVIAGRLRGGWRLASGGRIGDDELAFHLSNVISGMYSMNGLTDIVMLEERVAFDPIFDPVSFKGVPDVRLLVYRGVPCMAMVRLPTRESDGKANLHKGAVGAGLDIVHGITTEAVHHNAPTDEHPDTGTAISGIEVPGWRAMLDMAARCFDEIPLGYLGVDLVLDRTRGPLLLELNARPGLAVQLANGQGLKARLETIDRAAPSLETAQERVAFAEERFAAKDNPEPQEAARSSPMAKQT